MSSEVPIGTGSFLPVRTYNGTFDMIFDTWKTDPQCLIKSLQYSLAWAGHIASSLPSYASFANALDILKKSADVFTLTDAAASIGAFKERIHELGSGNAIFHQCVETSFDMVNSVCEVLRWLHTFKIIALTSKIFNRVCFISGATMVVAFGKRAIQLFFKYSHDTSCYKTTLMWDAIQNASLCTFGFFYAVGSVSVISSLYLLIPGTFALISTYGSSIATKSTATVTKAQVESDRNIDHTGENYNYSVNGEVKAYTFIRT